MARPRGCGGHARPREQGQSLSRLARERATADAEEGRWLLSARRSAAHVHRFEVAAETFALFRDALSHLRRRSDTRMDGDALLHTMARTALGGPCDEGRGSYQVSLNVCAECGRGAQLASGDLVAVGPETATRSASLSPSAWAVSQQESASRAEAAVH